ncbi:MAG: hypothetical protein ACRC62_31475 [Microcoleus sp.]
MPLLTVISTLLHPLATHSFYHHHRQQTFVFQGVEASSSQVPGRSSQPIYS